MTLNLIRARRNTARAGQHERCIFRTSIGVYFGIAITLVASTVTIDSWDQLPPQCRVPAMPDVQDAISPAARGTSKPSGRRRPWQRTCAPKPLIDLWQRSMVIASFRPKSDQCELPEAIAQASERGSDRRSPLGPEVVARQPISYLGENPYFGRGVPGGRAT
jgi:hypothetical protein